MKKIKRSQLLVFLVAALAIFLRSREAKFLFPFTMDEEYQAFLVKRILEQGHIPLIGVNVADTGLYLGPFFTYLSVIPYYFFGSSPIGGAFFAAFFGGLTAWFLIKLGEVVSKPVGLISGLFYAVSFITNAYDRKFWNPSLLPLLSVLLILSLIKLKKNQRWLLVIFAVFGLALHTHYALFALLPVALLSFYKFKLKFSQKYLKWGIVVFIFFLSPLILFDVRHDFVNLKALSKLASFERVNFLQTKNLPQKALLLTQTLDRLVYIPGRHDLAQEIVLCPKSLRSFPLPGIGLIIFLALFYLVKKVKKSQEKKLLVMILFSTGSFFFFWFAYPGAMAEYYLLPLFPLFLLTLAWFVEEIILSQKGLLKGVALGFAILFVSYNTWSAMDMKNSFGLEKKKELIDWVEKEAAGYSYNLDSLGTCHRFEGYRYLFEIYYKPPVSSYMDPYFDWLYPPEEKQKALPQKNVYLYADLKTTSGAEKMEWLQVLGDPVGKTSLASFGEIRVLIKEQ